MFSETRSTVEMGGETTVTMRVALGWSPTMLVAGP